MKSTLWILILVCSVGLGLPASAETIHVEKDGSGDFTVIQAAVDAASDGDIIMIGPGRFDDYETDPQWGDFRVWVRDDKSLTFQGAGPEETIIGPSEYPGDFRGWGIYSSSSMMTIQIKGIRFENLDRLAVGLNSQDAVVENCKFFNCYAPLEFLGTNSVIISGCQFNDSMEPVTRAIFCRTQSVRIFDVEILGCRLGIMCDGGTNDIGVSNCVIDGEGVGRIGVYFDNCGGSISGCEFKNLVVEGFEVTAGKDIVISDSTFENIPGTENSLGRALGLYGGDSFVLVGNEFSSSETCVFLSSPFDQFSAHGNHFFRDEGNNGYFIKTNDSWTHWEEHWDFSNNYWGTTDIEEISQWIFDGNDSNETTMFVDFLPLADGPVATEKTTLDDLKALYR